MAHATLISPLGPLTPYADDRAIVGLRWHDGPCGLATPLLWQAIEQLEAYFAGHLRRFDLPLAPAGTAFEQRVWRRMQLIPWGETISYGALASEVGSGPRAVARACARNQLTIVIPCHRVIGARGTLGGYSSGEGPATKAALLALEGVALRPNRSGTVAEEGSENHAQSHPHP